MRFWQGITLVFLALSTAQPLGAQTRRESLADVRQELSFLYVEIQQLKTELSTTGNTAIDTGGQETSLQRLDSLEGELRRLTGKIEKLEFRIDKIVEDGTNRIGDLEFRLVELEGGDVSALGETTTLGGGDQALAPQNPTSPTGGTTEFAVNEQTDFAAAKKNFDDGNFQQAADLFASFTTTYPGGPLTSEASYWRGEALAELGNWGDAGRSFLQSFSSAPDGDRAPRALYRLGISLDRIGQREDACLTLNQVGVRYPQSPARQDAENEMASLECNG